MKAFTLTLMAPLLLAAHEVAFDPQHLNKPISMEEILTLVAFLVVVSGGVFLLIRRRPNDDPPASLTTRHRDDR